MIHRRGHKYRTPRRDFGPFHHGACDGRNHLLPDSPYELGSMLDISYTLGYAVGAYQRRRDLEDHAIARHHAQPRPPRETEHTTCNPPQDPAPPTQEPTATALFLSRFERIS